MAEFLGHTNCPNCKSVDNLGVYDDHVFCFGCRYYRSKKSINPNLIKKIGEKEKRHDPNISLPDDYSVSIPKVGLDWLQKYNLTAQDIRDNHIGWSEQGKMIGKDTPRACQVAPCLVFPVYDGEGGLLMYQLRYMGANSQIPRFYTRGAKDMVHILGKNGTIVIVEDIISAVKVSKVARAIPLFGSSINIDLLVRLHRFTDCFAIWLDRDKLAEAEKARKRAMQFFRYVGVVSTELDPKCYSPMAIQTILGVHKC